MMQIPDFISTHTFHIDKIKEKVMRALKSERTLITI